MSSPDALAAGSRTAATTTALGLLQAYEPVLAFTRGELFLPTFVEQYVAECSLWAGDGDASLDRLVPAGALTLASLSEAGRQHRGLRLHLQFVQETLQRSEFRRWRREHHRGLPGGSRLTMVSTPARVVDVGVRLSLLVRGRVPGGVMAAAERRTAERLPADRHPYYGRVVRTGGYTVLQYWYFYAANDWRSTYAGVNDHEADWEMVAVYLADQPDDEPAPAWVAFSSHDHRGDDLRRRWDDPDLRREGTHPVVFAGAGSHSGAFIPGDYVVSVTAPPLRRLIDRVQRWTAWLRPQRRRDPGPSAFSIPYVDYARGDGVRIGPGHQRTWERSVIDDDTNWVRDYRGLWGLDTQDSLGGERAPAGPRYERSGAVRQSWADPLGWAGLQKVAPNDRAARAHLAASGQALTAELAQLDGSIDAAREGLRRLDVQTRAMGRFADTRRAQGPRAAALRAAEADLAETVAHRAELAEALAACEAQLAAPAVQPAPHAHLRHPHLPYRAPNLRRDGFLRIWAAVSTPLLLATLAVLITAPPGGVWVFLIGVVLAFALLEAVARRRLFAFLSGLLVAVVLGALAVILVLGFLRNWQITTAGVLVAAAVVTLLVNLRELLRGEHRSRRR